MVNQIGRMTATVEAMGNYAIFNMPVAIKKEYKRKEERTRSHLIEISNDRNQVQLTLVRF